MLMFERIVRRLNVSGRKGKSSVNAGKCVAISFHLYAVGLHRPSKILVTHLPCIHSHISYPEAPVSTRGFVSPVVKQHLFYPFIKLESLVVETLTFCLT